MHCNCWATWFNTVMGDGVLPYPSPLSLDVEAKDNQQYNFRVACIYVDARTVTMTSSRCLRRPGLGRDPQVLHAVGKFAGLLFFPPFKGKTLFPRQQRQEQQSQPKVGMTYLFNLLVVHNA